MLVNRCDCCGKETQKSITITFGCDTLFLRADQSEVCNECRNKLFKKSVKFRENFRDGFPEPSEVSNENKPEV